MQTSFKDQDDELVWSQNPTGAYTTSVGYKAVFLAEQEDCRWWKPTWKQQAPQKAKLFFWLALSDKGSTWDILQKRTWSVPRLCLLCKSNETFQHILMDCPFAQAVWKGALSFIGNVGSWTGASLEESYKNWEEPKLANYISLPYCLLNYMAH